MTVERLSFDLSTLVDNVHDQQVEFESEIDDVRVAAALRYDVLEAITGARIDGNAVDVMRRHSEEIRDIALRAWRGEAPTVRR